jgi:hypothetical protein
MARKTSTAPRSAQFDSHPVMTWHLFDNNCVPVVAECQYARSIMKIRLTLPYGSLHPCPNLLCSVMLRYSMASPDLPHSIMASFKPAWMAAQTLTNLLLLPKR